METRILIRIIVTLITFGYVASRPTLQHSTNKSSLSPKLLRHLLHYMRNEPQVQHASSEYGTLPPQILENFYNYDWQYSEYDNSSRRVNFKRLMHKRQAGNSKRPGFRRFVCARTKTGKCLADCGFGAPLDTLSHNRFFGCKPVKSHQKQES